MVVSSQFELQPFVRWVRIWCKQQESMNPICCASMVQDHSGGLTFLGICLFFFHSLGLFVQIKQHVTISLLIMFIANQGVPIQPY